MIRWILVWGCALAAGVAIAIARAGDAAAPMQIASLSPSSLTTSVRREPLLFNVPRELLIPQRSSASTTAQDPFVPLPEAVPTPVAVRRPRPVPVPDAAAPAAFPTAMAAAEHPRPAAPPLPFRVLGLAIEEGETTLFLEASGRSFAVRPGDGIADSYRLESVTDTQAVITYLPMQTRQMLSLSPR